MSDDTDPKVGRFIAIAFLAVCTLGFGMAGLCGIAFTFMALPDAFGSGHNNYAGAALVISVPSLLIGGGLAWWCGYRLAKRWRNDA
ncbi:hypothetical protein J2X16_002691 [Pelomonas aquatica]|uniref:Uncharacterized protein n=1 Tax=Pelomonas aquatica TaxID=431058 RepID=A0ABU1Z9P4_9BURK|nr:hypothetical protein [Pelomonas aquatica]MDR7297344.1 hypothetical protein [Pelomonas aquatica]